MRVELGLVVNDSPVDCQSQTLTEPAGERRLSELCIKKTH